MERTAISLATTGTYGNPYALPTGPTAHVSPGYAVLLAGIYRAFGVGVAGEAVKEVATAIATSFQCSLFLLLAESFEVDCQIALALALFSAVLPLKLEVQMLGEWEDPFVAVFVMLVCALTVRLIHRSPWTTREAVLAGLVWGFALLFGGVLLLLFLALSFLAIVISSPSVRVKVMRAVAIEVGVVALCLLPWVIRNEYALGYPILTRSNLGIELRISNNDQAVADEQVNAEHKIYYRYHPLQNLGEARKVQEMGEVAYNTEAKNEAITWIKSHPKRFIQLTLQRVWQFWFYTTASAGTLRNLKNVVIGIIHLIGLGGLVYWLRQRHPAAMVFTATLLVYPLPQYIIHVNKRHAFEIDWMLELLALSLVWRAGELLWAKRGERLTITATPSLPVVNS